MESTILWARHGENVANLSHTFSHRVFDGDLTEIGRQQAHALASTIQRTEPAITYLACSPLRRTRQTAEIVADHLGLTIAAEFDALRELNVGELDGRNDPEAWAIYNGVLAAWRSGDSAARFPHGEDLFELHHRLRSTLNAISKHGSESPALVVAHGANLRSAITMLTADPDPGVDLQTGSYAELGVSQSVDGPINVTLKHWSND